MEDKIEKITIGKQQAIKIIRTSVEEITMTEDEIKNKIESLENQLLELDSHKESIQAEIEKFQDYLKS